MDVSGVLAETVTDERSLAGLAAQLGAASWDGITSAEVDLVSKSSNVSEETVATARRAIAEGLDPLGSLFSVLRTPATRRDMGATYTPPEIIESMVKWPNTKPGRVVDPGTGSGRFLVSAGRKWSDAHLVGVEIDPLAALMCRANLTTAGLAERSQVILEDFRSLELDATDQQTLFLGNPPYVRHHQISAAWKDWLTATAAGLDRKASQLAGLHVHFFLATAVNATAGDLGCYITSAEWLDVNYGALVRDLLLNQLGGQSIHVLDATAMPFADAATTGVVSCFEIGKPVKALKLRKVKSVKGLKNLGGGKAVRKERLLEAPRWTPLLHQRPRLESGSVELGELCRVHRGSVTGANAVFVTSKADARVPNRVLTPSITRARELFAAGAQLDDGSDLRCVVDLPADLDEIDESDRLEVEKFLRWAKKQDAHKGYVARHRKSWWSVGLRAPAPILATYMARRPPTFVRNGAAAGHINIAHGLYPREPLSAKALDKLAEVLRSTVQLGQGRTYAGGLTKFEPREMERIPIPSPEFLLA